MTYIRSTIQRRKTLVIVLLLLVVSVGAYSMFRCHDKIGDPFLGFFFSENLLVASSQRATWRGVQAGVQPLDKILAVNGQPFSRGQDLSNYLWTLPRNVVVDIRLQRDGFDYQVAYPLPQYTLNDFLVIFVAPCTLGGLFLILGCLAFFLRPRYRVSLVYFFFCALVSLACMIHFEAYSGFHLFRLTSLNILSSAVAFHLVTLFPERSRYRGLQGIIYSNYFLVLTAIAIEQLFLYKPSVTVALAKFYAIYVAIAFAGVLAVMISLFVRTTSQRNRDKLKVLFMGIALGSPLILIWAIGFLTKERIFYLDQAMLLFLFFPFFLGFAILKKNIFDIDRAIRMGISYGLLGGALLVLFMAILALMGTVLPVGQRDLPPSIFFVATILAAIIITKSIGLVQGYVMRHIFRGRYNIISTLRDFTEKLSHATSVDEISNIMINDLVVKLGLVGGVFISGNDQEKKDKGYSIDRIVGFSSAWLQKIDWATIVNKIKAPHAVLSIAELTRQNILDVQTTRLFKKYGVQLLIKMHLREQPASLLLLGERRGDKELTQETQDLLLTIAKQASISLENAHLYKADAERERFASLGKVASILVHEIKNPLGIIRVSSETIRKRLTKDSTTKELATIISEETQRMDQTIQKFLNFAKPDPHLPQQFDINSLIADVVRTLQPEFSERQVALQAKLYADELFCFADKEKLRRVFYNLLLNAKEAVKSSDRAPTVSISSNKFSKLLQISIEDNGIGMEEETLKNIFEPFFSTKHGSTGLGLSIVKSIIDEHHGDIKVVSTKDKGTRFDIQLPLQ